MINLSGPFVFTLARTRSLIIVFKTPGEYAKIRNYAGKMLENSRFGMFNREINY